MTQITWLASLLLVSQLSFASVPESIREFKTNEGSIKSIVPKNWEPLVNYLNAPLTFISKKGLMDRRSVIDVIPFGVKDLEDKLSQIKKDPEEFYNQKEEWLEGFNGESLSYEPYREIKKDGASIYSIGIKYKNSLGEYLDQSFYISTKSKQIFFVKVLIPLDQEYLNRNFAYEVVESIATRN